MRDPSPPGRIAAFFDLDGTLLAVNSGALWLQRERRMGRVTTWQTVQAVGFLAAYNLGIVNMEEAMRVALQTVKGEREESVREWTRVWFEQEVVPRHEAPGRVGYVRYGESRHEVVRRKSVVRHAGG